MDVLQEFLTRRLVSVGSDDDRLKKVRSAKDKLVQALAENRRLSLDFTFAALNRNVPEDDRSIQVATAALLGEWQTYQGAFESEPVGLFRAMLTAALKEAWEKDARIAAAFAYLARDLLPEADVGSEGPIWTALFNDAQGRLEAQATQAWNNGEVAAPKFTATLPDVQLGVTKAKLDVKSLTRDFFAASGPTDDEGKATADGNAVWPNSGEQWSHEFAPMAAAAVADAVDKLKIAISPADLNAPLKAVGDSVAVYGATLSKSVNAAIAGLSRRSNLLWWKEAMFSPTLKCSYRELKSEVSALAMAIDIEHELPIYHPTAVEHFLKEAVRSQGKDQKAASLSSWITNSREHGIVDVLRIRANAHQVESAPGGLLVRQILSDGAPNAKLTTQLTAADFSVRILRELQALAATAQAS